jgi:hypothetical protein
LLRREASHYPARGDEREGFEAVDIGEDIERGFNLSKGSVILEL